MEHRHLAGGEPQIETETCLTACHTNEVVFAVGSEAPVFVPHLEPVGAGTGPPHTRSVEPFVKEMLPALDVRDSHVSHEEISHGPWRRILWLTVDANPEERDLVPEPPTIGRF